MTVKNYRILTASIGGALIAYHLIVNNFIPMAMWLWYVLAIIIRLVCYVYAMGYLSSSGRSPILALLALLSPGWGLVIISLLKPKEEKAQ